MSMGSDGMGIPPGPLGGPKPGPSGFRLFLYVLAGLGALMVLTCGGLAWYAYQNPAVREIYQAFLGAATAPGAEELRAAGCAQAGVMDMSSAIDAVLDDPQADVGEFEVPTRFVACQRASDAGPDCDEVARIYLAAVDTPPDRFVAQVNATGLTPTTLCQVVYAADGTRLGSLEEVTRSGAEAPEP